MCIPNSRKVEQKSSLTSQVRQSRSSLSRIICWVYSVNIYICANVIEKNPEVLALGINLHGRSSSFFSPSRLELPSATGFSSHFCRKPRRRYTVGVALFFRRLPYRDGDAAPTRGKPATHKKVNLCLPRCITKLLSCKWSVNLSFNSFLSFPVAVRLASIRKNATFQRTGPEVPRQRSGHAVSRSTVLRTSK